MGSFEGHVIPSVAYTILSLWWGFVTAVKYVRMVKLGKSKFESVSAQPCFCCPTKTLRVLPIESFVKVFGLTFQVFMELGGGVNRINPEDPTDTHLRLEYENAHHIMMILAFIVGAIVEIMIYYGVPLPRKSAYMFNLMAFMIQFVIMTGHLEGDHSVEFTAHKMWTILITFTFVTYVCECYDPTNMWSVYMRLCFFLAQGTWLMQIAFVVWPHSTNPRLQWVDNHAAHTWLNIFAMLHVLVAACVLMGQYLFIYATIRFWDKMYTRYEIDVSKTGSDKAVSVNKKFAFMDEKEYASLINQNDDESNESNETV
jgi:hypothetical protein